MFLSPTVTDVYLVTVGDRNISFLYRKVADREHTCYDWSSLSDFISLSLCSRRSKENLV